MLRSEGGHGSTGSILSRHEKGKLQFAQGQRSDNECAQDFVVSVSVGML